MAEQTIDRLTIQIQAEAQKGSAGLNHFIQSIENLKNLTSGSMSGLSRISGIFDSLNTSISGLKGKASTITSLANAIGKLDSVNLSAAALGMDKFAQSVSSLHGIGDSLQSIKDFGKGVTSISSSIKRLNTMDLTGTSDKIQEMVKVLRPLTNEMLRAGPAAANYGATMRDLAQAMRTANNAGKLTYTLTENTKRLNNTLSFAKLAAGAYALKRVGGYIGGFIGNINSYIEDMNLFSVAMGDAAESGQIFAQRMQDVLGVDAGEAMRGMATFQSMATSFGLASSQAEILSKNLTQLAYDYASLHNRDVNDMFVKFRSALAGELQPVRELGKDVSQARLQQELYALGIDASVTSLNQADKALLTYIALMKQSSNEMKDMSRTLSSPANALRVLDAQLQLAARAVGSIFIPALTSALPYLIAFVKLIGEAASALASFLGFELPEIDYSGVGSGLGDISSGLDDVGDAAGAAGKQMNKLISGFDELNILQDKASGGAGAAGGVGSILGDIKLPEYDMFGKEIENQVDEIVKEMKDSFNDVLSIVVAIGGAIAAWKVAEGFLKVLEYMKSLKDKNLLYTVGFTITGLGLFLDAWHTMKEAIQDILDNGPNFTNVTKLISGFFESLGAAFVLLGNTKTGGAMLIISGVSGIISDISSMINNGVNWENAMSLVKNLGLFLSGIGLVFGDLKLGGIGLIISGTALVVENFHALVTGFTTGDWSGVDWVEVASGALLIIGGLIIALKKIETISDVGGIGKATESVKAVSNATKTLDTTVSTGLSPNLTSLAKNLGLGLVIVTEVAAAALLITGAVVLLGKELEQVGLAWSPVIENGATVAAAMGIGIGTMAGIGVVTALLGSVGTPLIINIALGTAILAELGIATGLFIIEIWAIGKGLDEIRKAWEPVLNNGETIAMGIGIGTGLLVGIGVVTAALGAATVATAGALPLAIGIGTAILVELAAAFILFTESLVAVADELSNNLSPSLDKLNDKLPGLTTDMSDFVDFMSAFAGQVVRYTTVNAISGIAATTDTIIGWFTLDPIDKLSKEVEKISGQTKNLNDKLNVAIPELKIATNLLGDYADFINELSRIAGTGGTVSISEGLKVNLKDVGANIVTGFVEGIKSKYTDFADASKDIIKGFNNGIIESSSSSLEVMDTFLSQLINTAKDRLAIEKFKEIGMNSLRGFNSGINDAIPSTQIAMKDFSNTVITAFAYIDTRIFNYVRSMKSNISDLLDSFREFNSVSSSLKLNGVSGKSFSGTNRPIPHEVPEFANGGVVRKPTYGLFGEYPNANKNPEVVAPQSVIEESVNNANGQLVGAIYQMATMIVNAIETNATEVQDNPDAMFKVMRKKASNYKRTTGHNAF